MRVLTVDQPRRVAGDILSAAAREGLRAGDRLATERELASGLELTRATIRSAMALLEDEGVVSREVGRGTFLRADPGSGPTASTHLSLPASVAVDVSPADVMAARHLIEPAALNSVVENATITDFDEIERCLLGSDRAIDYDEFEMWDLALHRAIIRAAHNPLVTSMYSLVEGARQGETWGNLKRRNDSEERRHAYRRQHRAIAEALRNRDGRAAHEAMRAHLEAIEANLQSSSRS